MGGIRRKRVAAPTRAAVSAWSCRRPRYPRLWRAMGGRLLVWTPARLRVVLLVRLRRGSGSGDHWSAGDLLRSVWARHRRNRPYPTPEARCRWQLPSGPCARLRQGRHLAARIVDARCRHDSEGQRNQNLYQVSADPYRFSTCSMPSTFGMVVVGLLSIGPGLVQDNGF